MTSFCIKVRLPCKLLSVLLKDVNFITLEDKSLLKLATHCASLLGLKTFWIAPSPTISLYHNERTNASFACQCEVL